MAKNTVETVSSNIGKSNLDADSTLDSTGYLVTGIRQRRGSNRLTQTASSEVSQMSSDNPLIAFDNNSYENGSISDSKGVSLFTDRFDDVQPNQKGLYASNVTLATVLPSSEQNVLLDELDGAGLQEDDVLFDSQDTDPLIREAEELLSEKPLLNGKFASSLTTGKHVTKHVKFAPIPHDVHTFEIEEEELDVQMAGSKPPGEETSWVIAFQVFFPFLVAGFGTVGAGLVLDKVQHWPVFVQVSEMFILVPALLGLKGNLEMTLASRLSTIAHLGFLDTKQEMCHHIVGNLALIQAQAAVVAFLASVFALVLGWIPRGEFVFEHAILLCGSSLATASLASLILSAVMIVVIILARHFNVNPDNIATPIAASLGDLTTLGLLALIGTLMSHLKSQYWLLIAVIVVFLLLVPLWVWIGAKNLHTKAVLENGWSPVIFSMLISSAGGFILDISVSKFHGIAVFQPVINGIGGNLVAVQASRLSSSLHRSCSLGQLLPNFPKACPNPITTYCSSNEHARAARVLLLLVVPGHIIFMYLIHFVKAGHTLITPSFVFIYLAAALIQVSLLLYICSWMVHFMWSRKIDPDNSAIPYLTALGDLFGTALLAVVFELLTVLNDENIHIGE